MPAMRCDVERLVNALIGAEMLAQRKHAEDLAARRRLRPVVTVSRAHGAQGEAVAGGVAARLGLCGYDRDILDKVARSTGGRRTLELPAQALCGGHS